MTSSTADHRATGRGRTHLRCIESSHNDIINNRSQSYIKRGRGRTHKEINDLDTGIESSHNDIINSRSQSYRKR